MDPSQAIGSFLTPAFWVFCIVISLFVLSFRWIIEKIAKKIEKLIPKKYSKFERWWKWAWREAILPASPIIFGGLLAYFVADYPYPDPFAGSKMARLFIGMVAGLASGFLYPRVMYYLNRIKENKENQTNT